jgi:UDP-glucose 4-epimerase
MEWGMGLRTLVTGGAGYIGSHVVLALREAGHLPVVLDDLSGVSRSVVPPDVPFLEGDVADPTTVRGLIEQHRIEAVIHLAGRIAVAESLVRPLDYYHSNTCASHNVLACCVQSRVRHVVFSSSAAVYGSPTCVPVTEEAPTVPINPYGASKLATEWMLRDVAAAHDLNYAALRYFNVAGADPLGRTGQLSLHATHLLKVACEAAVGRREHVDVFGRDYDTPDGTAVRDYIHVSDLADIHVRALVHLTGRGTSLVLNCGYGRGYSVLEVLSSVQTQHRNRITLRNAPRRPGDPPRLVADTSKLRHLMKWEPRFDDLDVIVRSALEWERRQPETAEPNARAVGAMWH